MYSTEEKEAFVLHMAELTRFEGKYGMTELRDILLGIYANPVDSKRLFEK